MAPNEQGYWQGRKVLVTGAGGFIGSHLTEWLAALGAEVWAMVRYKSDAGIGWLQDSPWMEKIRIVRGDLTDADSVAGAVEGMHTVFHLGALIAIPYSYSAPSSYVQTNVVGTLNVLQAARRHNVARVVHTSTSEVYGTARYVPMDEKHPLQGQSPYSATKIGADKLVESFHLSFDLPAVTVRPFNTYGPRQSARAVIPTIITQALSGRSLKLGHLHPLRDFNYVEDTVTGFLRAAETEAAIGRTINLGSGREISIGDLVQLISELMNREIEILGDDQRTRPQASEVDRLQADARLAQELLGWHPEVPIKTGLGRTIAWMEANQHRYHPNAYAV